MRLASGLLDRRRLFVLLSGCWALAQPRPVTAQDANGTRIVAIVDNEAITSGDLADRIRLLVVSTGLPDSAETRSRLRAQALRGLIDERLQLQEARRLRIAASPAEIERAFAAVAGRNRLDVPGLERALRAAGVDPALFRQQIAAQIAWTKVVERELRPRVNVGRELIEQEAAASAGGDEELLLSEILLPVYAPDQEAQVLAEAEGLLPSLRGEAEFAALARQISAAPSAAEGGDLGWVRLSSLRPEFRTVLAALEKGRVSAPIRSPQGVHLVLLRDRRSASDTTDPAEREAQIRRRLEREQLERLADRRLRELRRRAFIDLRA